MATKNIPRICTVERCSRPSVARQMCLLHWRRGRKGIPLDKPVRVTQVVTVEVFWSRIDKTAGLGPKGECWEWRGTLTRGYGSVRFAGKNRMAHRVAYFLIHGSYPSKNALHSCDNKPCCNPSHLRDGTQAENIQDMWSRNRGASKVNIDQAREIKQRIANGEVAYRLAKDYGITDTGIYYIRDAKTWGGVQL